MKPLVKVLTLAGLLFGFHLIFIFLWHLPITSFGIVSSLKATFGFGIYILFYALWAYFLFSLLYIYIGKFIKESIWKKILLAFILMTISYLLTRTGDIIDDDFIENFQLMPFIGFVFTIPIMVFIGEYLNNK